MPISSDDILARFGYHPGTDETIPKHQKLRDGFIAFSEFLKDVLPEGRAKSTAFTKLQEASMWANFGVAELAPVVTPQAEADLMRSKAPVVGKPMEPVWPRPEDGSGELVSE